MVKKIVSKIVVIVFALTVSVVTVYAGTKWYTGDQFNSKGKTFTETYTKTGNFSNGLNFVGKYTEGLMVIQLKGEKKGLIFYSTVGIGNINVDEGAGATVFTPNPVNVQYSASGTNTVRVSWIQKTSGHLAAYRLYN